MCHCPFLIMWLHLWTAYFYTKFKLRLKLSSCDPAEQDDHEFTDSLGCWVEGKATVFEETEFPKSHQDPSNMQVAFFLHKMAAKSLLPQVAVWNSDADLKIRQGEELVWRKWTYRKSRSH